ncbi:3538_t:CDS:2 [Paraglomus brasilianum]|uniref:3538_t:CDS:1 n=1 Tax=Paraglomus brasilianum TaxID=144538 RepID=A0A9N9F599_9GLOM|nr:3538_t:CDS:2 [Paraglomus brasilianum]
MDRRRIPGPEASVKPIIERADDEDTQHVAPLKTIDDIRQDGRSLDKIRKAWLAPGIITQANGSAYIEFQGTKVACAVYGPRATKISAFSGKGSLNCEIKFAPFSCQKRRSPQRDPQEKELSHLLFEALAPAVRLDLLPKSTIDVFVTILQNDGNGSCLAASITAASVALADAGIEMLDQVAACSACYIDDEIWIDCTLREEEHAQGSLVLSYMSSLNEITHMLQSGEISVSGTIRTIEQCTEACSKIYSIMGNCLLESVRRKLEKDNTLGGLNKKEG